MTKRLATVFAALFFLTSSAIAAPQSAPQTVPPVLLTASAKLVEADGTPRAGSVTLVASVYANFEDTAPLWQEQQLAELVAGRYSINVGAATNGGVPRALFSGNAARWIGINVYGEAEHTRFAVVTLPYAAKAADADTVGGRSAGEFVLNETLNSTVQAAVQAEAKTFLNGGSFTGPLTSFSDTLTVTGFGLHSFSSSGTGGNVVKIVNTAAGAGNYSQLWLGTNEAPYVGVLSAYSSSYGGSGSSEPSGVKFTGDYSGGLSLGATHASGSLRFYSGGDTKRGEFMANGQFIVYAMGVHGFMASGSGGNVFAIRNSAAGASNYSQMWLGTNEAPYVGVLSAYSSTYNGSGSSQASGVKFTGDYSGGLSLGATHASGTLRFYAGGETERMRIDASGNVGIGTATPTAKLDVAGSINVTGNINAKYQDIAETVDSPIDLEDGTVVIIDTTANNRVVSSTRAYDTRVAGAVSRQPGMVLGDKGPGKELIATNGRVRIKVDASYGAIKIGDLLVTSPTPGHAMKSKPIKVGGHYIHRPGTILGKALEARPNGKGEILVLLIMQ